MQLDFGIVLEQKKICITAEFQNTDLDIWGHSREGKKLQLMAE